MQQSFGERAEKLILNKRENPKPRKWKEIEEECLYVSQSKWCPCHDHTKAIHYLSDKLHRFRAEPCCSWWAQRWRSVVPTFPKTRTRQCVHETTRHKAKLPRCHQRARRLCPRPTRNCSSKI